MATPFEYSRIHPTVLCISRSSDNTNHPKYSLSPLSLLHPHSPPPPPSVCSFSAVLSARAPHAPRPGIKTFEEDETAAGVLRPPTPSDFLLSMSGLLRVSFVPSFFSFVSLSFLRLSPRPFPTFPADDFRRRHRAAEIHAEPGRMGSANGTAGKLLFPRCQHSSITTILAGFK